MSDDTIKFPTKKVTKKATLDYAKWVAEGYIYVISKALSVVANDPKPEAGKYCIEIGFKTDFPGVVAPEWLIKNQPTLKIILNNQFFNLVVKDGAFSVTLFFGGTETSLTIPLAAIVWFQDSAGFTLSYEYPTEKNSKLSVESVNTDTEETKETKETKETTADIVSLDAFRSNNNDEGDT